ncbi:Crp/Fnr family transcriptional regulator [Variovorax sp. RB2P76]|uniref:Crp/Fnr family transcriptional regulator n=1 Tax=unclassified Variovorax TaxID=663243 RepID=UPI003F448DB2
MSLHPLIARLPPADRLAFRELCELRPYARNETILAPNEWTRVFYWVESGLVRVVAEGRESAQEQEGVTTDFIRRHDLFVGASLHEPQYRATHRLVAVLPCTIYLVPISALRALCEQHHDIALDLLEREISRMNVLRRQVQRVSSLSSEEMVGHVLYKMTQIAPAGSEVYDKRVTQGVIASYAGLSREVVNRTMREMERRGMLLRDAQGVHVSKDFAGTDFGLLPPEGK